MSVKRNSLAVLITYHDEGDLLRECLESLRDQDAGLPDEILIYDDASSLPPDPRALALLPARVIRGEVNRGPGYARTQLLHQSSCDYVHFHDSDDLFARGWTAHVRERLSPPEPAELIVTDAETFQDAAVLHPCVMRPPAGADRDEFVRFCLAGSCLVPATTFRREIGLGLGGYAPREVLPQSEDFHFHIRLAARVTRLDVSDRSLVRIRARPRSHSRSQPQEVWLSALRALQLLADEMPERFRVDIAEALARVSTNLFAMGLVDSARVGFGLARSLGPARHANRSAGYRYIAALFGQELAERLAALRRRAACAPARRGSRPGSA